MMINKMVEKCDFCGVEVISKNITVDFHYQKNLVIIEDVPVLVCLDCGERYYAANVWSALERIAKSKTNIKREIKVPVKEYNLEVI